MILPSFDWCFAGPPKMQMPQPEGKCILDLGWGLQSLSKNYSGGDFVKITVSKGSPNENPSIGNLRGTLLSRNTPMVY